MNHKTNGGLDPRRWQRWPGERDDLPLFGRGDEAETPTPRHRNEGPRHDGEDAEDEDAEREPVNERPEPTPDPAGRGPWIDRLIRKKRGTDADDTATGSRHDAAGDLPDRGGRSGEGR